jgi:CTP synthase (UTP-ammonia lyase)
VLAACPVDSRPAGIPRLSGGLKIIVKPDSLAYRGYRLTEVEEPFNCNYELNPDYQAALEKAGLRISGVSSTGHARLVELPDHKFFLGLGFVPQMVSSFEKPHPLITAFLNAAMVTDNCPPNTVN